VVGEFRDDDFGYTRGLNFQIPDTRQRRSYLDLKEATISGRQGPLEVTLGSRSMRGARRMRSTRPTTSTRTTTSTSSTTRSSGYGRPARG